MHENDKIILENKYIVIYIYIYIYILFVYNLIFLFKSKYVNNKSRILRLNLKIK